jgi:NAD(P)-dependent dehydrogenase (short-subunit alcohol dehydrogenase family)
MAALTGRRALVTGGAGGLGSVAVRTLLDMDAEDVLIVGRTMAKLEAVKADYGERVSIEAFDVARPAAWESFSDRRIDVLIPCAGAAYRVPFIETGYDDWFQMIDTNILGTMLAVKAVLAGMIERNWGRIILMSSVAATIGLPSRAVYGGTKASLEAWARALAPEIGSNNVLVNCLAPGMFPTEMTRKFLEDNPEVAESIRNQIPLRRFGDPEELAAAYRFLIETTYTQGSVLHIDGGWGAV